MTPNDVITLFGIIMIIAGITIVVGAAITVGIMKLIKFIERRINKGA